MDGNRPRIKDLIRQVRGDTETPYAVHVTCGACWIEVQTNSEELRDRLSTYFSPFLSIAEEPDIRICALEMEALELPVQFIDWPREAGKVGRKDSYADLEDGRACRKVRTGLQYLLGAGERLVFGECLKNDNQVVNLVVSQYIGWLMNKGWALCHASGVACQGKGLAIAAFSGGGKSTLALHLVRQGLDFISNDRTLISLEAGRAAMSGVPKHPRINPGTVLNNPALASVIPEARQRELARLPADQIWNLEEKYDALIGPLFGPERFQLAANLTGFLILNWQRNSAVSTKFEMVELARRPDLLAAVMKPPGPFYIPEGANKPAGFIDVDPEDYLPVVQEIPVFEVTGAVDFDQASAFCMEFVGNQMK